MHSHVFLRGLRHFKGSLIILRELTGFMEFQGILMGIEGFKRILMDLGEIFRDSEGFLGI